jgi:hypothetical protein
MRHSMTSATALLILTTLGVAAAQSQTATPPAQQGQQTQQQPQTQNAQPGSPERQRQVDDSLNSESGRAGTAEPIPEGTPDNRVFVNGALNLPGAPKDSQTEPAKFSARNAALDKLPIMSFALWLTDEQRRKIAATLGIGNAPGAAIETTVAQQLPPDVEMLELPDALKRDVPDLNKLNYARAGDRILLVDPPNRIVVGEIKN